MKEIRFVYRALSHDLENPENDEGKRLNIQFELFDDL